MTIKPRSVSILQTDDNPSAFPHQPLGSDGLPEVEAHYGMTLRDWFAGQALAGIAGCARSVIKRDGETSAQADARWSYERADAMIAARGR